MITTENYYSTIKQVNLNELPDTLLKSHQLVDKISQGGESWETYNSNETIHRVVDLYFNKLNEYLKVNNYSEPAEQEDKETLQPQVAPKPVEPVLSPQQGNGKKEKISQRPDEKKRKKYISKTVKHPPGQDKKGAKKSLAVEKMDEGIKFIRRYVNLNGKIKTEQEILTFLNSLQKAILERRIRKDFLYAKEITNIQSQLVKAYNSMNGKAEFLIEGKILEKLKETAYSQQPMKSILFLKRYVNLHGKPGIKQKAKKLLLQMQLAVKKKKIVSSDKYAQKLNSVWLNLKKFVESKTEKTLPITSAELSGIKKMIAESDYENPCSCDKKKEHTLNGIMTVEDAKAASFDLIGLTGEWQQLIGEACKPTHIFVYGIGGGGKSSFVLKFSEYLSSLGYKILYIAGEQFGTPAFTELLKRLNIKGGENFTIADSLTRIDVKKFDFVVLDSKDHVNVSLDDFKELKDKYSLQSFIILSQSTKTGNFTGSEKWRNEVDVMLLAENGSVKSGHDKNRWGGGGEMRVF